MSFSSRLLALRRFPFASDGAAASRAAGRSRRFAVAATAAYGVGGSCWVVFSDRLDVVFDRETWSVVQSLKGLAFVAVTGILLFAALQHAATLASASSARPRRAVSAVLALAAFAACAFAVYLADAGYRALSRAAIEDALDRLRVAVELEAENFGGQLAEQRRAVAEFARRERVLTLASSAARGATPRAEIGDALNRLAREAGLSAATFATAPVEGSAGPPGSEPDAVVDSDAADASPVTLVAPVATLPDAAGMGQRVSVRVVAPVALRPLPVLGALERLKARFLLARRRSGRIETIGGSVAGFGRPADAPSGSVAARLLAGESGFGGGFDDNGVVALAAARAVPGADWTAIGIIAESDALADLGARARAVGAATLALGGLAGLALALRHRRRLARRAEDERANAHAIGVSERRFRHTFEQAAVGMAHIGLDGRFLRVNQRLCELANLTREEILARSATSLICSGDRASVEADFTALATGAVQRVLIERCAAAAGDWPLPVSISAARVRGENDEPDYVVAVVEDISARVGAENALRASDERFRLAMKGSNEGLFDWRIDVGATYLSPRWKSMLGYAEHELRDTPDSWEPLLAPGTNELLQAELAALEAGEKDTYELELKLRHKDGHWVDVLSRAFPVFDENHKMVRLVGTHVDITERKRHEAESQRAATVFASTHEGAVVTDADGLIELVNPAFQTITGYLGNEAVGRHISTLQSGKHSREFYDAMWREIAERGFWRGEIWSQRKDGATFPEWLTISAVRDREARIVNYVALFTDISRLKQSETRLDYLAHHDPLTALPNRLLLIERTESALARSQHVGDGGALLFLDLDRFKTVNDSLGHAAGDRVLTSAIERWKGALPQGATLARLGGDEFVALLEGVEAAAAATLAGRLIEAMTEPFLVDASQEVYVGLSIGISLFPRDGENPDALIQCADSALFAAKKSGGGVRFYSVAQTRAASERLEMEAGLRRALERDELALQYQPLVSVADGRIFGAEALLRWRSPAGMIQPGQFIPLAEVTGLIVPIGDWVLREACGRMKAWLDSGRALATLAVNLSPRQFDRADIAERIRAALEETGLPPERLEIEITEGALMDQGRAAEAKLAALKALGLRISIDDFGTGHSSLAYLKRFPIDKLKLDRSFITDIPADPKSVEIAAAIIRLGRSLNLDVLAEGVETEAQAQFVALSGCATAQGFLFHPPLWEPDLLARLDAERAAPRLHARAG